MKRMNKYIMMFVAAIALVSCSDDVLETPSSPVKAGAEVQFGLSLEGTRTIYGEEANNAFPIYWVDGDKVQIYSPECLQGRNNAEYKVSVAKANQAYADGLTPTGANGVQWGSDDKADFYSIYPSNGVTFEGTSDNVTANVNIAASQTADVVLKNNIWYAADMNNVVMYAHTDGATAGNPVNLQYNPLSTVIEFELNVNAQDDKYIDVLSFTLTAPTTTNIAGDFELMFPNNSPTVGSQVSGGSNSIKMELSRVATLNKTTKTLKAKMNLLPITQANLDNWTVTVYVREGASTYKNYTKTLSGASGQLKAGMVHKIILPNLDALNEWTYTPANWMPQIPEYQRVYLSELSIPGAWYAGGKGYQAENHTIESLWNAGVRAFAVECRSFSEQQSASATPSRIVVSGTGSGDADESYSYYYWLFFKQDPTYLSDIIKNIASQISSHKDEFGVLVLHYAYGGDGGYRDVDFQYFMTGLQNEINKSLATNILTNVGADTTISAALGNLIIVVNVDKRINYAASGVNSMYATAPLQVHLSDDQKDINGVYFSSLVSNNWTTGSYSYTNVLPTSGFNWCFSTGNRTHIDEQGTFDIPTYAERKATLQAMIEHSKEIYDNSNHNVWFYFNCGGTQATSLTSKTDDSSASNFAKDMNLWLKDIIAKKINGVADESGNVKPDASPLGIVMFNYCTGDNDTYYGADIIKSIIEMNNKFALKKAPATRMSDYDGALKNGGNAIQ